jgi:tRNA modification GTPase
MAFGRRPKTGRGAKRCGKATPGRPYFRAVALLNNLDDTIAAPATPAGVGALGVLRLSGPGALGIADRVFRSPAGRPLSSADSHTVHYGHLHAPDAAPGTPPIDEVMASVFRAPRSFTTEDTVEFSCHGSPFVLERALEALLAAGARAAGPGEFTLRAFLHGRLDLAQAEAVADLIAADSAGAHDVAMRQLRGGISHRIAGLRQQLVDFAGLVELELDFVEEDVEFADRDRLSALVGDLRAVLDGLIRSFRLGNALRSGVPTVIAGRPNAGKSTLLNAWLQEERAIVSDVPGTTRDTIEEVLHLDGIAFRLIDTAGIRDASDAIERLGVERTLAKIEQSALLVFVFDASDTTPEQLDADLARLAREGLTVLVAGNKADLDPDGRRREAFGRRPVHWLSAARAAAGQPDEGLAALERALVRTVTEDAASGEGGADRTLVANQRHHAALLRADTALADVLAGLADGRSGELVALDLRRALEALGEITGEVTNDELLGSIFGRFCIGK